MVEVMFTPAACGRLSGLRVHLGREGVEPPGMPKPLALQASYAVDLDVLPRSLFLGGTSEEMGRTPGLCFVLADI